MPGRVRQAALVFLGPEEDWRKWCARALAVNRLHRLVCPQRPKEPGKPRATPMQPTSRAQSESDPWPYPLMTVSADKVKERLLAMEAVTVILPENDDQPTLRALLDILVTGLGPSRVSMAVVCDKRDSPWLKDELLRSFPVTVTVLARRGDDLTLLRRLRRPLAGIGKAG
jgi:hypothetical protein